MNPNPTQSLTLNGLFRTYRVLAGFGFVYYGSREGVYIVPVINHMWVRVDILATPASSWRAG